MDQLSDKQFKHIIMNDLHGVERVLMTFLVY